MLCMGYDNDYVVAPLKVEVCPYFTTYFMYLRDTVAEVARIRKARYMYTWNYLSEVDFYIKKSRSEIHSCGNRTQLSPMKTLTPSCTSTPSPIQGDSTILYSLGNVPNTNYPLAPDRSRPPQYRPARQISTAATPNLPHEQWHLSPPLIDFGQGGLHSWL